MESQRSLIKLWLVIVILLNFFGSLLFVIHFLSQFFVVVTKKKRLFNEIFLAVKTLNEILY